MIFYLSSQESHSTAVSAVKKQDFVENYARI